MRGGAVAARRAHNPKVTGSSPVPATLKDHVKAWSFVLTCLKIFCVDLAYNEIIQSTSFLGVFHGATPEYA